MALRSSNLCVPYLVRDAGAGLEESAVICRYLDHLDGKPEFDLPSGDEGWEALRLGALAVSLMDGVAVWGREAGRPRNEQSPTVIRHETDRAGRLIDRWETEIEPLDAGQTQPGADNLGLCAWTRDAVSRLPWAGRTSGACRVLHPYGRAPLVREDGSSRGSLTAARPAR
jgi:glutathione S-transferase